MISEAVPRKDAFVDDTAVDDEFTSGNQEGANYAETSNRRRLGSRPGLSGTVAYVPRSHLADSSLAWGLQQLIQRYVASRNRDQESSYDPSGLVHPHHQHQVKEPVAIFFKTSNTNKKSFEDQQRPVDNDDEEQQFSVGGWVHNQPLLAAAESTVSANIIRPTTEGPAVGEDQSKRLVIVKKRKIKKPKAWATSTLTSPAAAALKTGG